MRKERLIITIYENGGLIFLFGEGESGFEGGGGKCVFTNPKRLLYFLGGTDGHFIRLIKIPEKKN